MILLKGFATPNIYPINFFIVLTLEGEMNYSHANTTCQFKYASLDRNQELHCLHRPQHRPLQSVLGLFGHKPERTSKLCMTLSLKS